MCSAVSWLLPRWATTCGRVRDRGGSGRRLRGSVRPQAAITIRPIDAGSKIGPALSTLLGGLVVAQYGWPDAERASERSGALFYVPSGGIGGLDALRTACLAGVEEVSIQVAKPPAAWTGIAYVERLGIDLGGLTRPAILFDGPAREGVPHFPQNVNIAAVLALAGIGMDRTRLKVVADPGLTLNTHTIRVAGRSGRFTVVLENVPSPENPKTSWLACYSALAALRTLGSRVRYGS